MENDKQYLDLVNLIREQGAKYNPTTLEIGTMVSPNSVKLGDLVLLAEDLYIAEHLLSGYTGTIKVPYVSHIEVDTTVSSEFKDSRDTNIYVQKQITFTDGLKAGDLVAVQKLNDTDKYVILERVVKI